MFSLLVSAVMLGEMPPIQEPNLWETSRGTIQRREAAVQQQIATDNREQERENTYVIGAAIVAGLVLLGLISRSGKK